MATYTVTVAKHATLTANVVDTVTINRNLDSIEVLNRGTAELYFTISPASTVTVGGDNCYLVMPGQAVQIEPPDSRTTTVNLISVAALAYSVTGV